MGPREESQALLNRQASDWVEILKHGREEDSAEFVQWLLESPRHVRDYLLMETLDAELAGLESAPAHDIDASISCSPDVIALPENRPATPVTTGQARPPQQVRRRWSIAIAAGIAVIATVGGLVTQHLSGRVDFRTVLGEQRSIELRDGSLVHLNTLSHIRVRLTERGRDVQLLQGEAIFKVHRDAVRPFRVHTDHAVIEAIGTQFDVSRRQETTLVSVLEGRVRVQTERGRSIAANRTAAGPQVPADKTDLAAGEGIRINRNGKMDRDRLPSVVDSVAWRQRRLVFHEETLGHIAAEFNRYNHTPQLRVDSEALRERQYSGAFDADDPHALVEVLSQYADLAFDSTAEEIVIRLR